MSEDIVIVGGGPAGAAAAWALASAGRKPRLFERETAPRDKICGEFVSVEAQDVLNAMGIDPAALGAAVIDRLRLVHHDRVAETVLPFRAYGLSRRVMDGAMLDRAASVGAHVECGVVVRSVDRGALEIDGRIVTSEHVLLANGKYELRGSRRVSRGTVNDLIGFKSYFDLSHEQGATLAGHIEIMLFPGGYAGLQFVEGGRANLCLLVERSTFAATPNWLELLDHLCRLCPHLDQRLRGARELLPRPLTISGVPYGFRYQPQPTDPPKLYRVGDQCAVIPSFSGDGMAIAMHSGRAAAAAVLAGEDARHFHARQRSAFRRQIITADLLYRLGRPPALQPLIVDLARRWPGLASRLAAWTRIPSAYRSNRTAPSRSISDASWVT